MPLDPPPFPVGPANGAATVIFPSVMLDGFVLFVGMKLLALMGIVALARLVELALGITVNGDDLEAGL